MGNDKDKQAAELLQAEARDSAMSSERERVAGLKAEFADDAEFALEAVEQGWSIEKAKGEYCGVLKARMAEQKKQSAEQAGAEGAEALATGGSDEAAEGGDFLTEAREMAKEKGITVTAAMKQLQRQKPALHERFKQQCAAGGSRMYADAV